MWSFPPCRQTAKVDVAHKYAVLDVDYNPNKPFYLVTCGQDRLIKFWDSRKVNMPIKTLAGHTHWYVDLLGSTGWRNRGSCLLQLVCIWQKGVHGQV